MNRTKKDERDQKMSLLSLCFIAIRIDGAQASENPLAYPETAKFDLAIKQAKRVTCFIWYDTGAQMLKTEVACFSEGFTPSYRLEMHTNTRNQIRIQ